MKAQAFIGYAIPISVLIYVFLSLDKSIRDVAIDWFVASLSLFAFFFLGATVVYIFMYFMFGHNPFTEYYDLRTGWQKYDWVKRK